MVIDNLDFLGIEGEIADAQARQDVVTLSSAMAVNGLAMPITEGWHEKQRMAIPGKGEQVTDIPNQGTSVSDQ